MWLLDSVWLIACTTNFNHNHKERSLPRQTTFPVNGAALWSKWSRVYLDSLWQTRHVFRQHMQVFSSRSMSENMKFLPVKASTNFHGNYLFMCLYFHNFLWPHYITNRFHVSNSNKEHTVVYCSFDFCFMIPSYLWRTRLNLKLILI